jgi:cytochrome c553
MNGRIWMTVSVAALLASGATWGGDAAAGKAKSASCAGCHGAKGEGKASFPKIAGMDENKFIQALKDYKSGKRANAPMKAAATPLGDKEFEDLAGYYASLKAK